MSQVTSYMVERCGECEKLVNVFVNRDRCPYCRSEGVRIRGAGGTMEGPR